MKPAKLSLSRKQMLVSSVVSNISLRGHTQLGLIPDCPIYLGKFPCLHFLKVIQPSGLPLVALLRWVVFPGCFARSLMKNGLVVSKWQ